MANNDVGKKVYVEAPGQDDLEDGEYKSDSENEAEVISPPRSLFTCHPSWALGRFSRKPKPHTACHP